MKKKSFTPLSQQTINMEPRPVTTDQVDAVYNSTDALDTKMEKLRDIRRKFNDWATRQKETDGKPMLRYIDDAIAALLQEGDLKELQSA